MLPPPLILEYGYMNIIVYVTQCNNNVNIKKYFGQMHPKISPEWGKSIKKRKPENYEFPPPPDKVDI